MITPAKGKSFDPARIPEAVRKAGFDSPEVRFTAQGDIVREGDQVILTVPGLKRAFSVAGGEAFAQLEEALGEGKAVFKISGRLHGSHADKIPGITAETVATTDDSP